MDRNLLQENGWRPLAAKSYSTDEATQFYRRLALMVGKIRQIARGRLGDSFSMSRYLLSQFIVLYGLMRFDNYPGYVTTRALGMIAKELKGPKETDSAAS